MKPSTYRKWSTQDRGQAEGLLEYEASLCPGCGMPRHLAWNERNEGDIEAVAHMCVGCQARDAKAEEPGNKAGHVFIVAQAVMPEPTVS